jgi:c-di-GMP-binding flagellar brake protein YcgR
MFSLTSDCQRDAFRFHPTANVKVKFTDKLTPVIDISINGLAFQCDDFVRGNNINISIQLADNILIEAEVKVIHLSIDSTGTVCGCFFQHITQEDRELINSFILQQQKKKIRHQ